MPNSADEKVTIHDPSLASRDLRRWGWKRPLGPGQFRLSALFAAVTIIACALGLWKHWYDQQAPYRALRAIGARLSFSGHRTAVVVDLSECNIANDDLAVLSRVPVSMTLSLSGTRVTDGAVEHLIDAPGLTFVDLTRTGISDAGLRRLATARPDVSVEDFSEHSPIAW